MKNTWTIILLACLSACRQGDIRKTYDKSGKMEAEFEYKNEKKNGEAIFYYENGEIETEMTYKDDLPVGDAKFYDERGELQLEFNYETQEAKEYTEGGKHYEVGKTSDHKKNGVWKEYLTGDDELINEFTYVDDIKNGPSKNYWSDGSGKIYKTGFFKYGVPDSTWTTFDKDGKILWTEHWVANPNGKSSSSHGKTGK